MNVSIDPVTCCVCGIVCERTSNRQKYCHTCKINKQRSDCVAYRNRTFVPKGYNQAGSNNNAWNGGIGIYRDLFPIDRPCEICKATEKLLRHHKDGDSTNNVASNIQILCKKCHQNIHCVRDLKGKFVRH